MDWKGVVQIFMELSGETSLVQAENHLECMISGWTGSSEGAGRLKYIK